jgi:hypothetical protein
MELQQGPACWAVPARAAERGIRRDKRTQSKSVVLLGDMDDDVELWKRVLRTEVQKFR